MKMLNQLRVVAVLVVGTLVPMSLQAAPKKVDLTGILNPATIALGGKPGDKAGDEAVAKVLQANLSEAEKDITTNQDEQKLRNEVGDLRDKNDRRQMTDNLISVFKGGLDSAAKAANAAMTSLYAKMGNAATTLSASDKDTSEIAGECTKDTNVDSFFSLDSQMASEPVNYLRKVGGKALADDKREEKKADLAKYLQLIKAAKSKNKKRDEESAEPQVEDSLAYLDTSKPDGLDDQHRIDRLLQDKKRLKSELETGTDKQLDEVSKLFTSLMDPENEDKKNAFAEITGPFIQNLQAYRKSLHETATAAMNKAYKNCQEVAKTVGRDQPLSPASLLNQAFQAVTAYYGGDPSSYASTFFSQLSSEARVMQCKKTASKVEEQLGAKMQAQIAQLEGVHDKKAFLEGALATMTSLGKASAEVGKSFKKAFKPCNQLAEFKAKIESFVGSVQQHMAQQAPAQGPGQKHGTPVGGNQFAAHAAGPQQQQQGL